MTRDRYVRQLLDLYLSLRDTPDRPRVQDRQLARQLFDRGVDLQTISVAILLGAARRQYRDPSATPLPEVRSLAYFLPILEELPGPLPPDGYLEYLLTTVRRTPHASFRAAKKRAKSHLTAF